MITHQKKPFSDRRVREALNYAVNKEALCKVVYQGFASPAMGLAPEGVDYARQFGAWPNDPAKALLAEAGYPDGFEATLWSASNSTVYQKLLQFLQQQYARTGVKLRIQALESGQRVALMQTEGVRTSKIDEVQEAAWKDVPWVYRVVDRIIAGRPEKLFGFEPLPDGGCNFTYAELKE